MIARSADVESVMKKGSRCFGAWDLCCPNMSKPSHSIEKGNFKKKRTNITGRAGALMDLIVPRSAGYSGCAVWRKPMPNM
jgi:hypothetical protein